MHDRRWRTILWLFCLTACTGDDGTDVAISTGLPANQRLSTLDDKAVQDACRSIQTGIMNAITTSQLTRAECASKAVGQTTTGSKQTGRTVDVEACKTQATACVEDPKAYGVVPPTLAEAQEGCNSASAATLAGCEAAVSEYEACVNQVVLALRERVDQITCQDAAARAQSGVSDDFDATNIPECKSFLTKCPDAQLGVPTTIDD